MGKPVKFPPEVRELALRMVDEHRPHHESQWATVVAVSGKIGSSPQTMMNWVRQQERDMGQRDGAPAAEFQRAKDLERQLRELCKTKDILKVAARF